MGKTICKSCRRIYKLVSAKGFCRACNSEQEHGSKVDNDLDSVERASLTKEAINALHTRLKVVNNIPKKLWILWSKALKKALLALAESKTETEARIATERYFKLK